MPVVRIRILIGTTVVRIRILIGTTVVRIRIHIGPTVVRIASIVAATTQATAIRLKLIARSKLHLVVLAMRTFSLGRGYPHHGRADKDSYTHNCRADNAPYRQDRCADKNTYRHDGNMRFFSKLNYALFSILMVSFL